jgi:hypothetical protein
MEARFRNNKKITTDDFRREIEFLKNNGRMPTSDQVLRAMAEARRGYREAMIAQKKREPLPISKRNL